MDTLTALTIGLRDIISQATEERTQRVVQRKNAAVQKLIRSIKLQHVPLAPVRLRNQLAVSKRVAGRRQLASISRPAALELAPSQTAQALQQVTITRPVEVRQKLAASTQSAPMRRLDSSTVAYIGTVTNVRLRAAATHPVDGNTPPKDPVLTWISTTVPASPIRAVMAAHVKTTGQTSIAVNAKMATVATGVKFRNSLTVAIMCGSSG